MIWLFPDGEVNEEALDIGGRLSPKSTHLRLVYSAEELAETIRIFDSGLNDFGVQMLKMSQELDEDWRFLSVKVERNGAVICTMVNYDLSETATLSGFDPGSVQRIMQTWESLETELDWVHVDNYNLAELMTTYKRHFANL